MTEEDRFEYRIELFLLHPSWDLTSVSKMFQVCPILSWRAGQIAKQYSGDRTTEKYNNSAWLAALSEGNESYEYICAELNKVTIKILDFKEYFIEFNDTCGIAEIKFYCQFNQNRIERLINWRAMKIFGDTRINLAYKYLH